MGTIRLTLKLGDWFTRVKFYVIDADTSYWFGPTLDSSEWGSTIHPPSVLKI